MIRWLQNIRSKVRSKTAEIETAREDVHAHNMVLVNKCGGQFRASFAQVSPAWRLAARYRVVVPLLSLRVAFVPS